MGPFDAFGRMDRPRNPSGVLGMLGLDRFFEPGGQPGGEQQFSGTGRQAATPNPLLAQPGQGQSLSTYNPSWSENIQSGVQSGLESQGVSRALARDYGDKAQTAAQFTPVVGQALSANDFYRAARAGDATGMATAGFGMLPGKGGAAIKGAENVAKRLATEAESGVINLLRKELPEAEDGIKAWHATPGTFDKFEPRWRGATFFSPTEKGARTGASAGANDLLQHVSGATKAPGPVNMLQVSIPNEGISGLHLTPAETEWFHGLPPHIVGDPGLEKALKGMPSNFNYWDDIYDYNKLPSGEYEYIKKAQPPSKSYEDAASSGLDVYGRQHAHYHDQSDEAGIAQRIRDQGMKGYLVQDEGGLSIAMTDPSAVRILKRAR